MFQPFLVFLCVYYLEKFLPAYIQCLNLPSTTSRDENNVNLFSLKKWLNKCIKWDPYLSQANCRRVDENCSRIVFIQLSVRLVSTHPPAEEAIMHLFPYSFFNFSTSRVPAIIYNVRFKLCYITFCSKSNCYTSLFVPVVFIITVFSQPHPLNPYLPKHMFHRML